MALLICMIVICAVSQSKLYITIYVIIFLYTVWLHLWRIWIPLDATPADPMESLADVRKSIWSMWPERILIFVIGFVMWCRAFNMWCDTNGGNCMGFVSLANANSCSKGTFDLDNDGETCLIQKADQRLVYHPKGVFPTGDAYYTDVGHYAFCYLNQTWAYPRSNQEILLNVFTLQSNGQIACTTPTQTGSVIISNCNSDTTIGCTSKGYPSDAYGLRLFPSLSPPLNIYTTNQSSAQICPGLDAIVNPLLQDGSMVPVNLSAPWPSYVPSYRGQTSYNWVMGRPKPICPICLWYFMTQVAGTPGSPYKDESMRQIIEQCIGSYDFPTQGPYYSTVNTITCAWCPARNSYQTANPSPSFYADENYSPEATTTVFWTSTTYLMFIPFLFYIGVWLILNHVHVKKQAKKVHGLFKRRKDHYKPLKS